MRKKICKTCGEEKYITFFHRSGKSKKGTIVYRPNCNICESKLKRVKNKDRLVPPEQVYSDPVYKTCAKLASYALSRTKRDKGYIGLEYGFNGSGEMKWYLYKYFYIDIKDMLEKFETPTVDRIDPNLGYTKDNIRILTFKENTRLGIESKKRKVLVVLKDGSQKIFESTVECVGYYSYPPSHSSKVSCWVKQTKYKRPKDMEDIYYV